MKKSDNLKIVWFGNWNLNQGKSYFSKATERRVCFFMTMGMLLAGVFVKLGIF
jgi:hypothetical protein